MRNKGKNEKKREALQRCVMRVVTMIRSHRSQRIVYVSNYIYNSGTTSFYRKSLSCLHNLARRYASPSSVKFARRLCVTFFFFFSFCYICPLPFPWVKWFKEAGTMQMKKKEGKWLERKWAGRIEGQGWTQKKLKTNECFKREKNWKI